MVKFNGSQISYAQFQALVDEIGAPKHMFYRDVSGSVNSAEGVFLDRNFCFGVTFDPPASTATLTSDYPQAISANISVTI